MISGKQQTAILVVLLSIIFNASAVMAGTVDDDAFRWFWVFYEKEHTPGRSVQVYRPFYMRDRGPGETFHASLMPVGFWGYQSPSTDRWYWFFGFGQSVDYRSSEGVRDYDFGFFPLLFFGSGTAERDRYFLLWPFGGTLGSKFGMERISAWIFPGFLLFIFFPPASITSFTTTLYIVASIIPLFATYDYKDYRGWGVLWPLIHRGVSPLRDELRVLPFFSYMHKRGWYDRYSVLLLFNYEVVHFSDDEHRTFFFFPLFGRRWSNSGRISGTTVLWPFFSWGYDRRSGNRSYNLPWPFVQIQDQETPFIYKRIFFPFYGDYRYGTSRTVFVTPLYFRMSKDSEIFDSENYVVCVLFWYFKREYHGRSDPYYGRSWRYFKIWPLLQVEHNDEGDFSFNSLSLLPFRDTAGYERLYQPFWSIVEYRRFRNGEKRLGLLLRLYYQRWSDDFFRMQIPFVVTLARRENRLTELTFILSMFGYRHNGEGRYIRLFWIPIRIGDAEGIESPEEDGDEDTTASSGVDPTHPPSAWSDGSIRMRFYFF